MNTHIPRNAGQFSDWQEYESLRDLLNQSEDWEEVAVSSPKSDVGFHETWYRHKATGEAWRLIEPDPPYRGAWEQVGGI
jgi:hypothetical protein